jgi:hypothetical protein
MSYNYHSMNIKLITSIFLLLILSSISHAEFNDDYIEIGYVDDNIVVAFCA